MKKWFVFTLLMAGLFAIATPASDGLAATRILLVPAQEYSTAGNTEAYHVIDQQLSDNFKYPLNSIVHRYEMASIPIIPTQGKPHPNTTKITKAYLQQLSKTASADMVLIPQLTTYYRSQSTNFEGDTLLQAELSLRCYVYTSTDDHFLKIETSRYYYNDYSPDQEPIILLSQMLDETVLKLPYGLVTDAKRNETK